MPTATKETEQARQTLFKVANFNIYIRIAGIDSFDPVIATSLL